MRRVTIKMAIFRWNEKELEINTFEFEPRKGMVQGVRLHHRVWWLWHVNLIIGLRSKETRGLL